VPSKISIQILPRWIVWKYRKALILIHQSNTPRYKSSITSFLTQWYTIPGSRGNMLAKPKEQRDDSRSKHWNKYNYQTIRHTWGYHVQGNPVLNALLLVCNLVDLITLHESDCIIIFQSSGISTPNLRTNPTSPTILISSQTLQYWSVHIQL